MDRKMILSVLAVAVLGFVGMLLVLPAPRIDAVPRLPWLIEQDPSGRTQVFGFTLGATSLAEVRAVLGETGEISLFRDDAEPPRLTAEVFFEQIHLHRLRADFVMTLQVDQQALQAMYERGLRISQVGSGSKRIKLDPADAAWLETRPIRAISYLPKARLDAALLEQRFGSPTRTLSEPETGILHWLYPERGLDIARDPAGQVVIQYVSPGDFGLISGPLEAVTESRGQP